MPVAFVSRSTDESRGGTSCQELKLTVSVVHVLEGVSGQRSESGVKSMKKSRKPSFPSQHELVEFFDDIISMIDEDDPDMQESLRKAYAGRHRAINNYDEVRRIYECGKG